MAKTIKRVELLVPGKDGKLVPAKGDIPAGALVQVPKEEITAE